MLIIEIIGWTGAVALLAAYALISAGKVDNRSISYQALNVVGALGFVVNGWYHGAYPSMAMNSIWLAIAVVAMARLGVRQQSHRS
jgi:hypothetical protein